MNFLRVASCILACISAAAAIVIGALFGFIWCLVCIAAAALFAVIMFICKSKTDPAPPKKPDFMDSDASSSDKKDE